MAMITDTMTPKEVVDAMFLDRQEILQQTKAFMVKGGIRELRKSSKFPAQKVFTCKTSTCNTYFVLLTFKNKQEVFTPNPTVEYGAVLETGEGKMLVQAIFNMEIKEYVAFYFLPHLFKRYKERMGYKQEGLDLMKTYYKRNSDLVRHTTYRRNSKDGDKYVMLTCLDGAVFGRRHKDDKYSFILSTFIANDTMQDGYKKQFNEMYNAGVIIGREEVQKYLPAYGGNPAKLRK